MSGPGQPLDPVQALAMRPLPAPQANAPIDPVVALANGQVTSQTVNAGTAPNDAGLGPSWNDYGTDMLRSIPGGLAQGVAAVAGLPGDIRTLASKGEKWLGNKISPGLGDTISQAGDEVSRLMPPFGSLTSSDINSLASSPFGGYYKPKTEAGQYAETAASFIPAAFGGEASIGARILGRVLAPAAGSTLAGQLFPEDSPFHGIAQVGGAVFGGGIGSLGRSLSNALKSAPESASAIPSVADLKAAAHQAYAAVDASGMKIAPQTVQNLTNDATQTLTRMGYNATLHPKTAAVLGELGSLSDNAVQTGGASLQDMDIMHRIAGNAERAAGSDNPSDAMMSGLLQDKINGAISNLGPNDVVGSTDPAAIDSLFSARDLWSRVKKSETLDDIITKATTHAKATPTANLGSSLRLGFRQLAENKNRMAQFSPSDQDAITYVATAGSSVSPTNILQHISKLSPTNGVPLLAAMTGTALGHPEAFLPLVVGGGAKMAHSAIIARNARLASELMRAGPDAMANQGPNLSAGLGQISPGKRALLANLLLGGAVSNQQGNQQGQ